MSIHRRVSRALAAYALLLALLAAACASAVTVSQAQANPPEFKEPEPRGPDELFTDLPAPTYEGTAPTQTAKAAVLRAPMPEGSDKPEDDLPDSARPAAMGLRMVLEQQLEYLPQIYTEREVLRLERYQPRLRVGDLPRAGAEHKTGTKYEVLEHAARSFGAKFVFVTSYHKPAEGAPVAAIARYRAGAGLEAFATVTLDKPGKEDALVSALHTAVEEVTNLPDGHFDNDGKWIEAPRNHPPRIVKFDRSLRHLLEVREALENQQTTNAWIAWEDYVKREPDYGRAAVWGMEVFHALGSGGTTADDSLNHYHTAVRIARHGLKHAPNDVMLRGRLCWNTHTWHARKQFALKGLAQALKVQPLHPQLLEWYALVQDYWDSDRTKQAKWIEGNPIDKLKDGRVELVLGNIYFGARHYETGIEWYGKGLKFNSDDHETLQSLAQCAVYEAERLTKIAMPGADGEADRKRAEELYYLAADSMWHALELEPFHLFDYFAHYYLRAITFSFTRLPTSTEDLDRMFLVWAARDGLASMQRMDRLVEKLIKLQRSKSRELAKAAAPGDANYELHWMARLSFSVVDQDSDESIHTLWLMRQRGLRPDKYFGYMKLFGPLVEEYQPKKAE